jgi:hypothetical protein
MAKRKSAYRDYPPPYPGSPKPPYGYNPYTTEAWKAYASPMMNYTILALDESTNQYRHITNYAQGEGRQDAVERYYRNSSSNSVPTQLIVFPSESGRKMKQPAPKPQWEEVHLA